MKKVFVLVLSFVFVLGLNSCAKREYELPWDHFCYSADDGSVIELSPKEKNHIIDLLNNGTWYGEIAKCTSDVKFAAQRQSIGYCISEGIFNDFTQNKSLRLSDEDRNIINGYLPKTAAKETVKGIDKTVKIEAAKYDIGKVIGTVTITEESTVTHIVDNLNSLTLEKMEYNEPTAIEYELTFYNASEEAIKTISIALGGWIDYHGSFHSVVSGELDIVYIAGLFTAPDEEPGQNDILYAAAYPANFEYNDRNYRLVQGDGLKTTATQEELGELLGYIIREEDVSAFTQEYPSVDYVIYNGIYDYYENNRVAFYSLNAYTDLSIVCMYQLGEYVLYQSETIS